MSLQTTGAHSIISRHEGAQLRSWTLSRTVCQILSQREEFSEITFSGFNHNRWQKLEEQTWAGLLYARPEDWPQGRWKEECEEEKRNCSWIKSSLICEPPHLWNTWTWSCGCQFSWSPQLMSQPRAAKWIQKCWSLQDYFFLSFCNAIT